jgi:hypothetical protein
MIEQHTYPTTYAIPVLKTNSLGMSKRPQIIRSKQTFKQRLRDQSPDSKGLIKPPKYLANRVTSEVKLSTLINKL